MKLLKNKIVSLLLILSITVSCTTIDASWGRTKYSFFRSSFFKKSAIILGTAGIFAVVALCWSVFSRRNGGNEGVAPRDERRNEPNLSEACRRGDAEEARRILNGNVVSREITDQEHGMNDKSCLFHAVESRNIELVRILLNKVNVWVRSVGDEFDNRGLDGKCIFDVACENDDDEIFKLLAEKEFELRGRERDVDAYRLYDPLKELKPPLYVACEYGKLDLVKWLIEEKKCDVDASGSVYPPPLSVACEKGHLDIVKYLVSQGADCRSKRSTPFNLGEAPVHHACEEGHFEIVKHLVENCGVEVAFADRSGETLLHNACRSDNLDLIKFLVEKDPALIDKSSKLIKASNKRKKISKKRMSILESDTEGTPLGIAEENGNTEIADWISKKIEKLKK